MTTCHRLNVTLHALSRWRERARQTEQDGTDDEIRHRIGMAILHSRPVRLRSATERALKSVRNGALATFHQSGGVVLVICDGAVVSVYEYERERWEAMP